MGGKVRLDTDIQSFTNEAAGRSFTLTFTLSLIDTNPFDLSVSDMSPHCCFVYKKDPDSMKPVYAGVCTVQQFLSLKADSAEDEYRSNTFAASYSDYNTPASDQKAILAELTEFYYNLNAYIDSYSDLSQTKKSLVLPDYSDSLLDRLIGQWRAVKYRLASEETELSVKKNIYKPMLEQVQTLTGSIKEAADSFVVTAGAPAQRYTDFENAKSSLDEIQKTLGGFKIAVDKNKDCANLFLQHCDTLKDATKNLTAKLDDQTGGIQDDDLKNLYLGPIDPATNLRVPELGAVNQLFAAITKAKTDAGSMSDIDGSTGDDFKLHLENLYKLIKWVQSMDQDTYTSGESLDKLTDAVKKLLDKVDDQMTQVTLDIEAITAAIEADKSLLQTLEAQMVAIRPSIDLSNPEKAWFFTVNIS